MGNGKCATSMCYVRRIVGVMLCGASAALAFAPFFVPYHHRGTMRARARRIRRHASTTSDKSNLLLPIQSLKHDYYALRHGQSLPNVQGIIMSNPNVTGYGLSETGQAQAAQAAIDVATAFQQHNYTKLVVLTSDLQRARETATIVCQHNPHLPIYQGGGPVLEVRLRERWFGAWDGTTDQNYDKVWQDDAVDASHQNMGVESVHNVMKRTTQCILEWDAQLPPQDRLMVVLVAHGDVLQILQTAFEKMDGRRHRSLPHLETAQLRRLHLQLHLH